MNEDLVHQSVKIVGLYSLFPVLKNVAKWSLFYNWNESVCYYIKGLRQDNHKLNATKIRNHLT